MNEGLKLVIRFIEFIGFYCNYQTYVLYLKRYQRTHERGNFMHLLEYAIRLNSMFVHEVIEIPSVFWKYYDLYRRKRIGIIEFTQLTNLSQKIISLYLKCI